MNKMGKYCKAYPVSSFREFKDWHEKEDPNRDADSNSEVEKNCSSKSEPAAYYFLQENYVVTRDVFIDGSVVFDDVSAEWIDFCTKKLGFEHRVVRNSSAGASEKVSESVEPQPLG